MSLFERGEPGPPLATRSSSVPGETNTRDGGSLSGGGEANLTAADEYDEGLQRTHTRVRKLDGHDSSADV